MWYTVNKLVNWSGKINGQNSLHLIIVKVFPSIAEVLQFSCPQATLVSHVKYLRSQINDVEGRLRDVHVVQQRIGCRKWVPY